MEKPDANGFVTVKWPSKNIPHGGIFHSRVVQSTVDRQEFLKVLLEESKLTLAQRKKSALALREYDEKTKRRPQMASQMAMPLVRPRTSRRRSLSCIRESGAFDYVPFLPQKRGEDRERLKQKLADVMTYGDSQEQTPPAPARVAKPAPKLPTNEEMWHDLVTQIRERAEWLAEMEHLGEAGPHREIIKDQIAERMRALDALGIDSICSTARSTASGFSTLRSREQLQNIDSAINKRTNTGRTNQSKKSQGKQKRVHATGKKADTKEENVAAYKQFSPLQYSPRRRV